MAEPIKTKRCSKCKEIKPLSEFHKNCTVKDGYQGICKVCNCKQMREYHQTERGKIARRKGVARYQQTKKGKDAQKRYRQSEKGKVAQKRFCIRHPKYPEKVKAYNAVNNAIRAGKFLRPDTLQCHFCPKQAEQYHHPDYNKPLSVVPVCIKCHKNIHNITPILCV